MADDRVVLEVEAALFSSGDPVAVDDLVETTGEGEAAVRDALEALRDDYDDRTTALEVSRAGDKWTMQVQTGYADQVRDLAPMEVPDKALKTLALVAYHQPILQSDLQTMVGSRVYDHVRELADLGLVTKRRHERTYELRTTDKFPEYFGLETTDPDEIRDALAEAAGVPQPPQEETSGEVDAPREEGEVAVGEAGADAAGTPEEPGTDEGETRDTPDGIPEEPGTTRDEPRDEADGAPEESGAREGEATADEARDSAHGSPDEAETTGGNREETEGAGPDGPAGESGGEDDEPEAPDEAGDGAVAAAEPS